MVGLASEAEHFVLLYFKYSIEHHLDWVDCGTETIEKEHTFVPLSLQSLNEISNQERLLKLHVYMYRYRFVIQ